MAFDFEGARQVVRGGGVDMQKLATALVLNVLYLIFALMFFRKSFNKVLDRGLVKLQ